MNNNQKFMRQNSENVNALPDFLAMQRVSFCWFISQGLNQELSLFSKMHDFSQNTDYLIFGTEYQLIKPSNSLFVARKYNGNYRAQLVIPIEVRNKIMNSVRYKNQFPIITLPLMTTHATFVINGCERVIVSQIVRSPGIYFEKYQKKQKQFRRKLSIDINKLRTFLPSGEAFISEFDLFFSIPIKNKKKKLIPNWNNNVINYYSLKYLKEASTNSLSSFLQYFKFYRSISRTLNSKSKEKLVQFFLKWLKIQTNNKDFNNSLKKDKIQYTLKYFQYTLKLLLKYQLIESNSMMDPLDPYLKLFNNSKIQIEKMFKIYNQIVLNSQTSVQFNLNYQLVIITKDSNNWIFDSNNVSFLQTNINRTSCKVTELNGLHKFSKLRPIIYFSTSFKDQLKYIFKKDDTWSELLKKLDENPEFDLTPEERDELLKKFKCKPERHKYLKTKTQFLLYRKDHEIKTNYHKKYDEKDLCSATLIPEYGSWIRFGFQKNLKINQYKYPIKNQEDELIIQLDKINQKSVLALLKEMGLTDLEIYQNLQYADFFYFDKPLLINSKLLNQPISRFNLDLKYFENISKFSRIFDTNYYRLGEVGRFKINNRLNLKISQRVQGITYEDIFGIIDHLIDLTISNFSSDDIDHLKNRRVRSVGELLQNLFGIGFQRIVRKLGYKRSDKMDSGYLLSLDIVNATIREFFGSSQLSQYLDQTNPLSSLTHRRRISGLGPGGFDRERVSFAVRDIHPSHYGRICPIETSEGQNVGLISSLAICARVNKLGFLETPFWRVINGRVLRTGNPIYLTADIEDLYKIAPADIGINKKNYLKDKLIPVRYKQDFLSVSPHQVDFITISTIQIVSIGASLIPFFEHDDANRALMGSNMQRQSVPLVFPQKPIVGTGLENQIAVDSGMTLNAHVSGIVNYVTANKIIIKDKSGKKFIYPLQKYLRSNQQTCINHRPIVWKGEKIKSGQILTDGPGITSSELALGQNVLIAYMPWQGYNFEDAILISERLIYDDIFTSIHIERYNIGIDRNSEMSEQTMKLIPNLNFSEVMHLNDDGIVKVGTFVKSGDILVGKVIPNDVSEPVSPEVSLLRAIFGTKVKDIKDNSYRMPEGEQGRVIETVIYNRPTKLTYQFDKVYVFIAQLRKIQVGDKIAGRHGNKGIISRILPRQDMPFLPDGRPIDILLNPLGVPSRMNVGQLYECLLGLAGDRLNLRFKILPFDEMHGVEMSRILINKKLRQASIQRNESWLFNPYAPGKIVLIDGRTGNEFENPITVGNAYMLKLIHLVDDKMHARATGPYSLITQQPLRGKALHGGQRFGEMEVWALEGFGAAFTLKELLTIKSDDMDGRNDTVSAIITGEQIPQFGIPESFKVLLQELRSIGLDMSTYKIEKFSSSKRYEVEVNLIQKYTKRFLPISNKDDISFNQL